MAEHKVYQYYQGLTPTTRGIIIIVGIGASLYIAYKVYKGIKIAKLNNASNLAAGQALGDTSYLSEHGINPSYVNSQYETWSGELVSAFNGCGTDFNTVLNIFNNIQNEADLTKLISSYGTRKFNKCMSWIHFFGDSQWDQNLGAAMANKLSSNELNQINNILASKGIKYRF